MIFRAFAFVVAVGIFAAACGAPALRTEEEICGSQGCDGCVGLTCPASPAGGSP